MFTSFVVVHPLLTAAWKSEGKEIEINKKGKGSS